MPQSPLHVGIDCRFASEFAGLGTYTRELVAALLRQDRFLYTLFVRSLDEPWLALLAHRPHAVVLAPIPHYSFAEQTIFPRLIRQSGIDLLFLPQFNAPLFCPVPFVCTVHDLILHHFPNSSSFVKKLAYRFLMRSSVRRARRVIAVSQTTRTDLIGAYGQSIAEKVEVIYPGIHERFRRVADATARETAEKYNVTSRFLLYVGNAKQHKNVQMLIDAFQLLHRADMQLVLIVSGKEREKLTIGATIRLLSDVHDAHMLALYSAAAGLATASLYEGFGLPVLEAMACGCPVLVTNRGALPEVTNGHAIVVEPTLDAVTDGLRRLLETSPAQEGVEWAKTFTWEKSAQRLAEIFQR